MLNAISNIDPIFFLRKLVPPPPSPSPSLLPPSPPLPPIALSHPVALEENEENGEEEKEKEEEKEEEKEKGKDEGTKEVGGLDGAVLTVPLPILDPETMTPTGKKGKRRGKEGEKKGKRRGKEEKEILLENLLIH